jgi:Carbohydrate/starch-binding module (family 21)
MKKLVLFLLVSMTICSCSKQEDLITETSTVQKSFKSKLSQSENVKLVSAWTSYSQKYGLASYLRKFKVEVKNLAYNKTVIISHKMTDGSWKDFPLSYLSSTNDNTEIWSTNVSINNYGETAPKAFFADEFVVRYETNGQKYWDNNNNLNYKMNELEGSFLRNEINILIDTDFNRIYNSYYNPAINAITINTDIRNLNPTKVVTAVYTTDNWNTTKTASLHFNPYITVGAQQFLSNPNRFGIERWSVNIDLPLSVNRVEYALSYRVNGIEYWDNNFGKNYTAVKE